MRKTAQFKIRMKAAERARKTVGSAARSVSRNLQVRKADQSKSLKRAIAQALERVDSAEKSFVQSKKRFDVASRAVPKAQKELEYAENTRIHLSVQYDLVLDTSPIQHALDSSKLKRSGARKSLTQAKTSLDLARSELRALLK
jgi:outer membrane protein TolC